MDDFGTGYSSLSYLKRFPLHELKIDRSFLKDIVSDSEDQTLVAAMIYLAHEFDLNVVAEGVETPEQLSILQELGCDDYQGFLLSPAIPSKEFATLMHKMGKK